MTDHQVLPGRPLGERFDRALLYAARIHRDQLRKASPVPYIAHLLGVSALVLEHGGDEDQAIAALLHDAPEDQGGAETLTEIREIFGFRVADIVDGCTEHLEFGKRDWQLRKTLYLERITDLPEETMLVIGSDKVHNGRAILDDGARLGSDVFEQFGGKREGTIWYYNELAGVFRNRLPAPLADEFHRILAAMTELSAR